MKRKVFILFAVVSLLISLTGCGSSGGSNYVAPTPTTMTSVKVSLTQNGVAATGADAALYTPAAAMREGLNQAQTSASSRTSIGENNAEGVYSPSSKSDDGVYTFTVPTGEYTLIASKGGYKTVVTNLRAATTGGNVAEDDGTPTIVTDLQPTGTITGKVATGTAPIVVTGSIVFLENTSCVAIANADGSFTMTGVPVSEKAYSIAAMSNMNGKMFRADAKQVTMTKTLSATLSGDLELKEVRSNFTIKGYVKGSKGGIADVLVMASNGNILSVGTTDENGKFTINVNDEALYTLSVIGAVEQSLSVKVTASGNTPTEESLIFTISTPEAPSYCCIKGSIQIPQSFLTSCGNDIKDVPDFGRYLVRLIGSSTANTSYNSSMKADFKASLTQSETLVEYAFDSVPEGTYSVLVDPAGNGFLGSEGNISVSAGETKTVATISVKFVKPVFTVYYNEEYSNYVVEETYPFFEQRDTTENEGYVYETDGVAYCRKIDEGNSINQKLSLSGPDDGKLYFPFIYEETGGSESPFTTKGKYEISIQKYWSDPNTGIKATLTDSYVFKYDGSADSIGNIVVKNLSKELPTNILNGYSNVNYYDGFVSAINGNGNYFYCKNLNDDTTGQYSTETGYMISKGSILYTNGEVLQYREDITDSASEEKEIDFVNAFVRPDSATLISKKYLGVVYSLASNDNPEYRDYYAKVLEYGNSTNPFSTTKGTYSLTNTAENHFNSIDAMALSESPSGEKCYLALSKWIGGNNNTGIIEIYEVGAESPTATYPFYKSNMSLLDFKVLRDGSFYIELGDSAGLYKAVRIISTDNKQESKWLNRKSCFMDKHGFMYRIDTKAKKVIKTTSLDGEPLETLTVEEDLNGILGLEENSTGSSTLYVW